jgi:tetratricopeptide (TPR) repeat protein
VTLLRMGRLTDAAQSAQQAVKLSRDLDPIAKQILADIYHEQERHAEAEALLTDVLRMMPDSDEARLLQGLVKLDLGKFDEASTLLHQVLAINPASHWARLGLGVIAKVDGRTEESRTLLATLVKEQPNWTLAHFRLGETLLAAGDLEAALAEFRIASATSRTPALVRVRTATSLFTYGQVDLAIAEANAVVAAGGDAAVPARALLVDAFLAQKQPDLAEQELLAAIKAQPKEPAWRQRLGRLYLMHKRPQQAMAQLSAWSQLSPNSPIEPAKGMIEALVMAGQMPQALAAAKKLAATAPDNPESEMFLGWAHEITGDLKGAEAVYQRLLTRVPANTTAVRALASVYRQTGRDEQALDSLKQALARDPAAPGLHADLAQLYHGAGRTAEAIAEYRKTLERDSHDPLTLNNLAFLLSREPGQLSEAVRLADRAYALAPASPQVADTLGWLSFLQGNVDRALLLLTQASTALPDNPDVQAHLKAAQEAHAAATPPAEAVPSP